MSSQSKKKKSPQLQGLLFLNDIIPVKFVDKVSDGDDGEALWDDEGEPTIFIKNSLSNKSKDIILLHEMLHLIETELGLGLSETAVRSISRILYSMGIKPPKLTTVEGNTKGGE